MSTTNSFGEVRMPHEQGSVTTLVPCKPELLLAPSTKDREVAWRRRLSPTVLVLSDVLLALLVTAPALVVQAAWGHGALSQVAVATVVPAVSAWVVLRALFGLYPGYGLDAVEELRRQTYATLAIMAVLAIFALSFQVGNLLGWPIWKSRSLLAALFLGLLFLAPFGRSLTKRVLKELGLWGKLAVVLSYKETGNSIATLLQRKWELGYKPIAVFDYRLLDATMATRAPSEDVDYRGALAGVVDLARARGVDTAVFAMPYTRREQLVNMVDIASECFRHVLVIPNLSGVTNSAVIARDIEGTFAVEIKHNLLDPLAQSLKRALDVVGVVTGGLLISPLLLMIAILIKLDSPGPVFYRHQRLRARDEHFRCLKFRTMHADAERLLNECLQGNPALQAEWERNHKLRDDPRVTRVGRFLRKTSLDELPQLWNVLRGEMSLIGPRPIVDAEIPKYGRDYALYSRIRPGMSGFWQVSGRSNMDYSERVAMDAYYVRNWSVWLDIIILVRTVKIVLLSRGAY